MMMSFKQSNQPISMPMYAGLECGGTTCRVSFASPTPEDILEKHVIPTTTPEETLHAVETLLADRQFDALGIASFGPIVLDKTSPDYGMISTTPKPHWANTHLLRHFQRRYPDTPIAIDTDVNAPAIAESAYGPKHLRGKRVVYVTIGTGVGAGMFLPQTQISEEATPSDVLKVALSMPHSCAEAGHIMPPLHKHDLPGGLYPAKGDRQDGFKGVCPFHGRCLEGLVAAPSLAQRLGVPQADLAVIDDSHELWDVAAHYLSQLCLSITLIASPDVIVLGGGVMGRTILYEKIRTEFKSILNGYMPVGDVDKYIISSKWGGSAGVVGALTMAAVALEE
ncbi:ROK family protein [Kipferlia bialata]|uniref:fructokinase n=1 Tax=Kipferlia bialata TaxID=797122 RepID=A0A9K3GLA8_9EUKA|nr:ROK family protein [Kipferlia bialata]|eukprot:g8421.t1